MTDTSCEKRESLRTRALHRTRSRLLVLLAALFIGLGAQAQIVVKGTVTDATAAGLIGVNVAIKGTGTGAITDIDGNYTLTVPNEKSILTFTYIGYVEVAEVVGTRRLINVAMKEDAQNLEEVVVIGYGVTKKSDLTGSVASIKAADLEKFPVADVGEMLRGQAAGVQVTLGSTAPGGRSSILIRGNRSLSSEQTPLYIVDGMIVPHMDDVNASDIASIEVLKDASSQAIYGSRASNGVIIVTTKRGKEGKIVVDLNSYVTTQRFTRNFDFYSPQEWLDLRWTAKHNDGTAGIGNTLEEMNVQQVFNDDIMYDAYQNGRQTNWEELMLGNALQQKHDLSVRGGSEKLKFAASLGYFDQNGLLRNSGYTRANFRSNVDYAACRWLDFGVNVAFTRSETESADGDFNSVITMAPYSQAFDAEGNALPKANTEGINSPYWKSSEYSNLQKDDYLTLGGFINVKPFKGFSYRASGSLRTNNRERGNYKTKRYPSSTGQGEISQFDRSSWLVDNVLNYTLPIANPNHVVTATLIQSVEEDLQTTTGFTFINSPSDMFDWNMAADSEIKTVTRSIKRTRSSSFAARVQYNLMQRYMITASVRRDGASVFGTSNKWANFPSVALAWRLNEESFLRDAKWIDQLKVRASYGVVGNWAIPAYRTLGLSDKYEYLLGDNFAVGYLPQKQLLNKDLKWETTESLNFGIDFSFLGGRLSGSTEFYRTNTKNLLVERVIPSITSYTTMWDNLGRTQSSGWEGTLNARIIDNQKLTWTVGASMSVQRNQIKEIDGRLDENGKPIPNTVNKWFAGESINVEYEYVFGGIWQEDDFQTDLATGNRLPLDKNLYMAGAAEPKPGDIKLVDNNGDGKIDADDRKIFNLDPSWYASFNTSLAYKGFDLNAEFYTVQGVTKRNLYAYSYDQGGTLNGKLNGMKVNYWTPENRSNEAPRPQYTAAVGNFNALGLQDASYFRLRSLTLGYTLPRSISSKWNVNRARVYVTGTNLFTITDYKSYSPEKTAGDYPEPQTYTVGINLSF